MTSFFKLSGAGNDFIALVEPKAPPTADEVRLFCRRGLSLGADGLFTLERTGGGARMVYWNADGGRSDLCLNGSRCAAQLAFHLGWRESSLELSTDAGALAARRLDETRVEVELPPLVGELGTVELDAQGARFAGWLIQVGVPHLLLPWPESLETAPLKELGPELRRHPAVGPAGANVSFVFYAAADRLAIRTFERGVEAETLACGTAVVAAVAAGVVQAALRPPVTASTAGGFEIVVSGDPAGGRPVIAGDARLIAQGELLPGALATA